MSVYNKGVKLEREVIQIFKNAGFNALRSAGSHSPFDVVIWKETGLNKKICFVAFVQCKVKALKTAPQELLTQAKVQESQPKSAQPKS